MMKKIVIGIDPDSERHGVAIYADGKLESLQMLNTVEVVRDVLQVWKEPLFSIENVMANQFVYARNVKSSKAAQSKVAMHIGRCQQAQVELIRALDSYGIKYVLHKPQSGNWSDKRELFERITGWAKQSNPDTRAAAYFGFLALGKQ